MPETKSMPADRLQPFIEDADIDLNAIPYKDKFREQQRLVRLEKLKYVCLNVGYDVRALPPKPKAEHRHEAFSIAKEKKALKQKRKEKKDRKREMEEVCLGDDDDDVQEQLDDDFLEEARLLGKLKKGKITEDEV